MSVSRSGRIVRCSDCKSAIRIPKIDKDDLTSGDLQVVAEMVKSAEETADVEDASIPFVVVSADSKPQTRTETELSDRGLATNDPSQGKFSLKPSQRSLAESKLSNSKSSQADSSQSGSAAADFCPVPRLPDSSGFDLDPIEQLKREVQSLVDKPLSSLATHGNLDKDSTGAQADAPSDLQDTPLRGLEVPAPNFGSRERSTDSLKAGENSKPSASKTPASNPPQSGIRPALKTMDLIPASRVSAEQPIVHSATLAEHRGKSEDISTIFQELTSPKSTGPDLIPEIKLVNSKEVVTEKEEAIDWEERLENANQDRRMLARFFAGCLCVVAIVNMTPALYHWYHWAQMTESMELPRWIYIQVFVGAIHLVYAVFLFQVSDWSAMRAVSVAMLLVAFVFGSVSTGLLVSGGQGDLSGFLGIPFSLSKQAAIWCVAMLCLATLMSYWGGKESLNWQRAELLLKDILARSAV
ncbi:MAG: hypothetical protein ACI87E_001583 [Mariniblastus sp.]|jgi:hypothetical protein